MGSAKGEGGRAAYRLPLRIFVKKRKEKKMKRIKKTLCLLLLVFSVMLVLPVTANASTNGHT